MVPPGAGRVSRYCIHFREEKERDDRERARVPGATSKGKKAGQKFTRFAKEAVVKQSAVDGSFGPHIESSGAAGNAGGKTGGRLNAAGGTDSDEDGTLIECLKDFFEVKGSLAKPADVRADFAPAGAAWNLAW